MTFLRIPDGRGESKMFLLLGSDAKSKCISSLLFHALVGSICVNFSTSWVRKGLYQPVSLGGALA